MKRILLGTLMTIASASAFAVAPGGPNCGWGNMLFKGQSGLPSHFVASTTNGTSGNATFGMTSGTNGCSTNGTLTYGGKPLLVVQARGHSSEVEVFGPMMGEPVAARINSDISRWRSGDGSCGSAA